MPPILLLKGDKNFYGELKPAGNADPQKLERPPPPPNPMSNVKLSNQFQRDNAVNRITNDLNTPENLGSSEDPKIQAELNRKDIEKLKDRDDLYSKMVKFVDDPMGVNENKDVVPDTEMRISSGLQEGSKKLVYGGEAVEDVRKGIVAPAGEVVADISDSITKMINDKLFMAVLVVGGVYLAGQFLQGAGKSLTKSKKMSED
tara:strand:+ start:1054 stop:1659 length:606 start_codon:yes stop_codon:yes gene_type:complete